MQFYSERTIPIIGPVVLLPQAGSVTGGSKRPVNSFAILREGWSILFDAPFSWVMEAVEQLARDGHPPEALVLSHRDLAGSGDAFEEMVERFSIPILLHPDDWQEDAPRKLTVPLHDPMESAALAEAGAKVIRIPGHSPGSIMLHLEDSGGILLAGDSAVAPGPEQSDQTPRLERPLKADEDDRFLTTWKKLVGSLPLAAVLPLHGQTYLRQDVGDAAFDKIVSNIWEGSEMNPRKP